MNNNYTPGQGCQCHAHSEEECGCDVDWTPKEVYELREQRDRLHGEREFFQSAFNEQGDVLSKVIEQRDRLAEELNELKEEYGTWWAQKRIAIDELKDVTEQRDRLAEALRDAIKHMRHSLNCPARLPDSGFACACSMEAAYHNASEALAAVEGGSDE